MSKKLKIPLDDVPLFDDTPPPPHQPRSLVTATYDQPVPCTFCKAFCTTAYTNPAVPMCERCFTMADTLRTAIEKKIIAYEAWRDACHAQLAKRIAQTDQTSVSRFNTARQKWHTAVDNEDADALLIVENGIDKAIAQNTPLGRLLKYWREVNKADIKAAALIAKWDEWHYLLSQTPKGKAWTMPANLRKPITPNEPAEQLLFTA